MQAKAFGSPVSIPVCDGSTVQVECVSGERLGVNVTWKLRLQDVPPASLPDVRDIGMFSCASALRARSLSETQFLHLSHASGACNAFLRGSSERMMCLALGGASD